MEKSFFIPGNTPSSKNSKIWTGRFLISSKTTSRYVKSTKEIYLSECENFKRGLEIIPRPLSIAFFFVRDSKRRFDYINVSQIVLDLMVENNYICDDAATEIEPIFTGFITDKKNAGVIVKIITEDEKLSGIKKSMWDLYDQIKNRS